MKRINDELYIDGMIGSEKYASIFRHRIYGEENYTHTIVLDELIQHVDGELRIHSIVYPAVTATIIQNSETTKQASMIYPRPQYQKASLGDTSFPSRTLLK